MMEDGSPVPGFTPVRSSVTGLYPGSVVRHGGYGLDILFPEGLIGCEEWRRFVLEADPATAPVLVLRSLDEPAVSFLVTDPYLICPDYRFELAEADAAALEAASPDDVAVLCILNVRLSPPPSAPIPQAGAEGAGVLITANLLGPLVIHKATGRARQVVLANSNYSAHHVVVGDRGTEPQPATLPGPAPLSAPVEGKGEIEGESC